MNTPNKLTTARMCMVPLLVLFMLTGLGGAANRWICLVIFCVASITDWLDGYIARKDHLVTNYGKLMDPLADKLLVCSALVCLTANGKLTAWVVVIIIAREFIISGIRLIAAEQKNVIAANMWGKAKTVVQMIMIIVLLLDVPALHWLAVILEILAVVLTLISLGVYIMDNMYVLMMDEEKQ